jgi:hypothetical protein
MFTIIPCQSIRIVYAYSKDADETSVLVTRRGTLSRVLLPTIIIFEIIVIILIIVAADVINILITKTQWNRKIVRDVTVL